MIGLGKVYLIGAGPGDEDLVTLKAVDAIAKCDALLYDRLAPKSLLRYAKNECEIYYCGKTPNNHYMKQDEINRMLIKLAKSGKTVGRVKGGDPYIFGRGGEEALELRAEGIEFETISGVTSPAAVLNYAGIPLTHRGISQSFHIFTAMTADKLNIDWDSVVKFDGTLIFMMGLSNLELISEKLMEAGMEKSTPAAVVMKGTTSKQKKVIGDLENISEKAREAELKSPCIIAFGETISLSDKLNWYEEKPLFGLNICITRSKKQAGEYRERLKYLGAEVTEVNSIKTELIDSSIDSFTDKLSKYDYVVLNSVNGVEFFFEELQKRDIDMRNIKAEFPAIGEKTAEAIKKRGIIPSVVADEFTLEGLYEALKDRVNPGENVLIPKSESGRSYLIDRLTEDGLNVDSFNLYRTICGDRGVYDNLDEVDIIIFTSPSTVRNMVELYGEEEIRSKYILSIGPITAKELDKMSMEYTVCEKCSLQGVEDRLIEYVESKSCRL